MADGSQESLSAPDISWILNHQELVRGILAHSSGAIGELWAARRLTALGYGVRLTNDNSRQRDLLVTSPSGIEFGVEVKTVRGKGAPYLVRKCPDPLASRFWFFVHAPRDPCGLPMDEDVRFFILSTEEAAEIWGASNPRVSNAPDIKWKYLRHHEDCWAKLPG